MGDEGDELKVELNFDASGSTRRIRGWRSISNSAKSWAEESSDFIPPPGDRTLPEERKKKPRVLKT